MINNKVFQLLTSRKGKPNNDGKEEIEKKEEYEIIYFFVL